MRARGLLLAVVAVTAALAGCGGHSGGSPGPGPQRAGSAGSVHLGTRTIGKLGPVLVDGKGDTVYVFAPDKRKAVTCGSTCLSVWPPVVVPDGQQPVATGGVRSSLLSTVTAPNGDAVATYAGWPLYTYVGDYAAGQANGQAVDLNGGEWYVLGPTGRIVTR